MVYHPSASERFENIVVLNFKWQSSEIISGLFQVVVVVSSNSLRILFLERGPSTTSRAPTGVATEQTENLNLWNDRKNSPSVKGLTIANFQRFWCIKASTSFARGPVNKKQVTNENLRYWRACRPPAIHVRFLTSAFRDQLWPNIFSWLSFTMWLSSLVLIKAPFCHLLHPFWNHWWSL